jgi:hypothetical protein
MKKKEYYIFNMMFQHREDAKYKAIHSDDFKYSQKPLNFGQNGCGLSWTKFMTKNNI